MLDYKEPKATTTVTPEAPATQEEKVNLTPAAVACLAAGIALTVYSLLILLVEAIPGFKTFMTFSKEVGPLSGKVAGEVLVWLVTWAVLYFTLRNRQLDFKKYFIASVVLIALGLFISFPPFYQLFTAK